MAHLLFSLSTRYQQKGHKSDRSNLVIRTKYPFPPMRTKEAKKVLTTACKEEE